MNILALDTAMSACAVTIARDKETVSLCEPMKYGQAERLMPMISQSLEQASIAYSDLDQIITTLGPGGFTGLRVGLSAAKALALALGVPALGLSTFQALAASYASDIKRPFYVLIESRREELFAQAFNEDGLPTSDPIMMRARNLYDHINDPDMPIIGDGAQRFFTELNEGNKASDQMALPKLDKVIAFADKNPDILSQDPQALYLRGADISQPKNPPRKIKA